MAEWLESLTSNHLPLIDVSSNPAWGIEFIMWGSYPASLRKVGGSTQVPARDEIMLEGAPEVFLHH